MQRNKTSAGGGKDCRKNGRPDLRIAVCVCEKRFLEIQYKRFLRKLQLLPVTDRDFFIITADWLVKPSKYQKAGIGEKVFFDTFSDLRSGVEYVSDDMENTVSSRV